MARPFDVEPGMGGVRVSGLGLPRDFVSRRVASGEESFTHNRNFDLADDTDAPAYGYEPIAEAPMLPEEDVPNDRWARIGSALGENDFEFTDNGGLDGTSKMKGWEAGLLGAFAALGGVAKTKAKMGERRVKDAEARNKAVVTENAARLRSNQIVQHSNRTALTAYRNTKRSDIEQRARWQREDERRAEDQRRRDERFRMTNHQLPNGQWVPNSDPNSGDGSKPKPDNSKAWDAPVDEAKQAYDRAVASATFSYREDPSRRVLGYRDDRLVVPADTLASWDSDPNHPVGKAKREYKRQSIIQQLRNAGTVDAGDRAAAEAEALGLDKDADVAEAVRAANARLGGSE